MWIFLAILGVLVGPDLAQRFSPKGVACAAKGGRYSWFSGACTKTIITESIINLDADDTDRK